MSDGSGGLDPDKIRESIRSKKRYRDMPDLYDSFKEAFTDNFLIRSNKLPAIVFIVFAIALIYKTSGSVLGVVVNVLFLAIAYAGLCALLAAFYKLKFMTRQIISLLCMVSFALLLFGVLVNPAILFFN